MPAGCSHIPARPNCQLCTKAHAVLLNRVNAFKNDKEVLDIDVRWTSEVYVARIDYTDNSYDLYEGDDKGSCRHRGTFQQKQAPQHTSGPDLDRQARYERMLKAQREQIALAKAVYDEHKQQGVVEDDANEFLFEPRE